MYRPISRKLFASEVFEQLKQRILDGEARPGSTLPAERTLATMLNVNRNAVREGLKRLEQAGLVSIRQGGFTQVLDYRHSAGLALLPSLLVRRDGTIDTTVIRSIVELRSDLGPLVARLAAERRSDTEQFALDRIVEAMRAAKERIDTTAKERIDTTAKERIDTTAKERFAGSVPQPDDDLGALARLALDFWSIMVGATKNIALELAFNSLAATYGTVIDQMKHVMADEVTATDDYARLAAAVAAQRSQEAITTARRIAGRGASAVLRVLDALDEASGQKGSSHGRHHQRRPRPRRKG